MTPVFYTVPVCLPQGDTKMVSHPHTRSITLFHVLVLPENAIVHSTCSREEVEGFLRRFRQFTRYHTCRAEVLTQEVPLDPKAMTALRSRRIAHCIRLPS